MIRRFHFEIKCRILVACQQFNPVLGSNFEMIKRFHFGVKCGILGP